jgi:hypothetical protein
MTKETQDMKFEPILKKRVDRMTLKYAYHKPLVVRFLDM